jgi:multisubunit Na+/H+ antiporter MnhB subunit/uncharacterized protein (UPF0248 family)
MKFKLKPRNVIRLVILIVIIISNLITLFTLMGSNFYSAPHDADRLPNGNTLFCTTATSQMLIQASRVKNQIPINEEDSQLHKLLEVNQNGDIIWEYRGLADPHEVQVLPNGHLLVADTNFDRIVEINYPNKEEVWEWDPTEINWTEVNPEWGPDHYFNNPITYDWTHVNDVDFKSFESWDAILISLRNFDTIVEINYTAARYDESDLSDASHVTWWYGDYLNHSKLFRQHNPDYLKSGNIIIADSGNDRIVEVNRTTKEQIWEYSENIRWARDADELEDGNILITDCYNNRIIEVEKETKEIVWSFAHDLIIPYEADLLDNGNILIANEWNGYVFEVNRDGKILWSYGHSFFKTMFLSNSILMVTLLGFGMFCRGYDLKNNPEMKNRDKMRKYFILGFYAIIVGVLLFIIINFSGFITMMTNSIYPLLDHSAA